VLRQTSGHGLPVSWRTRLPFSGVTSRTWLWPRLALASLLLSFVYTYGLVLWKLAYDWSHDDNYSHGWLIVPLSLFFVWQRRDRLRAQPLQPALFGAVLVVFALALLIAGLLGAELFLSRVSIVVLVAGAVLFLLGSQHLRILAFPLAFLLLMIPLPAIIFNQIAFPLQLLASRFGEVAIAAAGIPVLREGNVMILANTTLEVAEACSGIRSLVSLLTLGIVYAYFTDQRTWVRVAIALSTIPVAILTNAARVAGTGIAAHYYGPGVAEGFFHTFSGWLVFVCAMGVLMLLQRFVRWVAPAPAMSPAQ
jgi:exosortase